MTEIASFIEGLPKAGLHLNAEGILERKLELASRNDVALRFSNSYVTDGLKAGHVKRVLEKGMRVTVNSDNPA